MVSVLHGLVLLGVVSATTDFPSSTGYLRLLRLSFAIDMGGFTGVTTRPLRRTDDCFRIRNLACKGCIARGPRVGSSCRVRRSRVLHVQYACAERTPL